MNRTLFYSLIALFVWLSATVLEASVNFKHTYVAPLGGVRAYSDHEDRVTAFVVGGSLRQEITPEISLQGRAGLYRSREDGYLREINNTRFFAADLIIHTKALDKGRVFGLLSYTVSGIKSDGEILFGIGIRPSTKKKFAQPVFSAQANANVLEGSILLEKDIHSLWTYVFGSKEQAQPIVVSDDLFVPLTFKHESPERIDGAINKLIVASYLEKAHAQRAQVALMKRHGVESEIHKVTSPEGTFYRVQVGSYVLSAEVAAAVNLLRTHNFTDAYHVRESNISFETISESQEFLDQLLEDD